MLSGMILGRCKETLSPSTLKRLWGYVDGYDDTRYSTLNILSHFVGYKNWDDFVNNLENNTEVYSTFIMEPSSIMASDLEPGDRIKIGWLPNRECLLECTGHNSFKVIESQNSKLLPDNTFCCTGFVKGEPLYIENLRQKNNPPTLFVAGNKGGLSIIEKVSK